MSRPFDNLSWEELNVVEHSDHGVLFPTKLRERDRSGKVKETDVLVRCPRPLDHLEARRDARAMFDELGLDPKADADYLEQAEDLCLLAKAIRDKASLGQYADAREIAKLDDGCIRDIKERINHFKTLLDPRQSVRTDDEFWELVESIWEKRNILPLADIAGHEQHSFIMRLVWEARRSRTESSLPQSSETSTQAS